MCLFFCLLRNYTTIVGVWLYILAGIKYCFLQKSNCSEEAPRSGERDVNKKNIYIGERFC